MTYSAYLHLDTRLSAQKPVSDLHDEMLFVIIHQTKELWLKQMLHELKLACQLVHAGHFAPAYKAMSRITDPAVMTLSWDVLATLTRSIIRAFACARTSSGFQSVSSASWNFALA